MFNPMQLLARRNIIRPSFVVDAPVASTFVNLFTGQVGYAIETNESGATVVYPYQYVSADGALVTYFIRDFWFTFEMRQAWESDATAGDIAMWEAALAATEAEASA